jgi:hypothetical protein
MADLQGFTLKGHPWELPSGGDGVIPGAADGWLIPSKGWALVFHTTTTTRAAAILRDGFDLSPPREVGGFRWLDPDAPAGRVMPSGVWASIRPTIPDDRDTWMPCVCDEPWEVLQIHTPAATLARKCVFEPTWPVVQFCTCSLPTCWGCAD